MSDIYGYLEYLVNRCKNRNGEPPKLNRAFPAFVAAYLVRERVLGAGTVTQASAITGVSRASIDNALIILESGDLALARRVLAGVETLSHAAKTVRNRVKLIAAFQNAAPDDRAALGRVAGATVMFDHVVVPAL